MALSSLIQKLKTPMADAEKEELMELLSTQLAALDAAAEEPVDKWGRTVAQQKEDMSNPCRCASPTKSANLKGCCGSCGFWLTRLESIGPCGSCGNFGKCSSSCEDNEEYWEPRTWQTCRDCEEYVLGLSDHQKKCEEFIRNMNSCDECGLLYEHAPVWDLPSKRCTCEYDQDDLNKMDLVNRCGF